MSATPSSAEKKRSFRDLTKENVEFVDGKACCNIGGGEVKRCRYFQEKYEPGNMVRHFRSRHGKIAKEKGFFREDAEAPEERPPRPPKKIQVAINRQIVSSACARLVTVNNLPLSAIDWPAMQDILKPLADAMHAEAFSTYNTRCLLNSAAERIRGKMADEMRGKLICIKIDGASRHGRHIIGINAQFRPREGEDIVIRTLGMVEVREKQTGKFLKGKILEILAKYEIGVERIFCVTCDNGANMLATVRELRKEFEIILNGEASDNEDDEVDEQTAWTILRSVLPEFQESVNLVRCGVHTLQLAVNDVTKRYDQHIRRVSEVAKHCRKVVYAHNFEQRPLPPLPPRTRWGGIYDMLSNFAKDQEFYVDLGSRFEELDLTDSWSFIHDYLATFEPVYYCTKNMQMYHVGLSDLVMAWLDAAYKVSLVESSLAKELSQALDSRLQMLKKCLPLKAALFLDPRFHYLDSNLFKDDEKAELRKFIRDTSTRIAALSSVADETPKSVEPKPNPRDGFQAYLCGMFGGQPTTSKAGGKLSLDEQILSLDATLQQPHTLDVWEFWQSRKSSHPELYQVASLIFSVPSNQVSVERAFSALRLVLADQRTSLGEETLEIILILKLNVQLFNEVLVELTSDVEDE